jgi:RHS repeat-associated protein
VTNSAILALFTSNYFPYGIKYATIGREEFTYTGKPYDAATGLYYEGARYYDAALGRFTIQDSHVYSGRPHEPEQVRVRQRQPGEVRRPERARIHFDLQLQAESDGLLCRAVRLWDVDLARRPEGDD